MDSVLIAQGLDLLLYGMGTVFTFLTLLVAVTGLMSMLVSRFSEDEPIVLESSGQSVSAAVEPRIARVIQLAIDQHRGRRS